MVSWCHNKHNTGVSNTNPNAVKLASGRARGSCPCQKVNGCPGACPPYVQALRSTGPTWMDAYSSTHTQPPEAMPTGLGHCSRGTTPTHPAAGYNQASKAAHMAALGQWRPRAQPVLACCSWQEERHVGPLRARASHLGMTPTPAMCPAPDSRAPRLAAAVRGHAASGVRGGGSGCSPEDGRTPGNAPTIAGTQRTHPTNHTTTPAEEARSSMLQHPMD
jgi:hypothetical protein